MNNFIKFLKITVFVTATIVFTSCSGTIKQDLVVEANGSGEVVYTLDYSSSMAGVSDLGNGMIDMTKSMLSGFGEFAQDSIMEGRENYEDEYVDEINEDNASNQAEKSLSKSKDTTFTINQFLIANKDSIKGNKYYNKTRLAALKILGSLTVHEVTNIETGKLFFEIKSPFKTLKELEDLEFTMSQLVPDSSEDLKKDGESSPSPTIDGFSPELLVLFVAANGANTYTLTNNKLVKSKSTVKGIKNAQEAFSTLLGKEPMVAAMMKSFLPKTYDVNITVKNKKINSVSDPECYIKGDFSSIKRSYDFTQLLSGEANSTIEIGFRE